jgi:plastocyanin
MRNFIGPGVEARGRNPILHRVRGGGGSASGITWIVIVLVIACLSFLPAMTAGRASQPARVFYDLAWIVPSPADIEEPGFGIASGSVHQTMWDAGVRKYGSELGDAREVAAAGFVQAYFGRLALPDVRDPDRYARSVNTHVVQFTDEVAADAGWEVLRHELESGGSTLFGPRDDVAPQAEAFRAIRFNDDERYLVAGVIFRAGSFVITTEMLEYAGDPLDMDPVAAIARSVRERAREVLNRERPAPSQMAPRLEGYGIARRREEYRRLGGVEVPLFGMSPSAFQSHDQWSANRDIVDAYNYHAVQTDQSNRSVPRVLLYGTVWKTASADAARSLLIELLSSWVWETIPNVRDVRVIEDERTADRVTAVVSYVYEPPGAAEPFRGYYAWYAQGTNAGVIDAFSTSGIRYDTFDRLRKDALACFDADGCIELTPVYEFMGARTAAQARPPVRPDADFAVPAAATPAGTTGAGTPTPATPVAATSKEFVVTVFAHDIYFDPKVVTIPADADVTFVLSNQGAAPHNFSIDDLGVRIDLSPGETREIVVNAPAGEYRYYCNIPGHKEAGMVGFLISDPLATRTIPSGRKPIPTRSVPAAVPTAAPTGPLLDLAWIAGRPTDPGLAGYGQLWSSRWFTLPEQAEWLAADDMTAVVFRALAAHSGWRQAYHTEIALPSADDPDYFARRLNIDITQTASPDGASEVMDVLAEEVAGYQGRTEVRSEETPDQVRYLRGRGQISGGGTYELASMLINEGDLVIQITLVDFTGDAPALSDLASIAEPMIDRATAAAAGQGDDLALRFPRFASDDALPVQFRYDVIDGEPQADYGEFPGELAAERASLVDEGIDSLVKAIVTLPDPNHPDNPMPQVINLIRFTSAEAAEVHMRKEALEYVFDPPLWAGETRPLLQIPQVGDRSTAVSFREPVEGGQDRGGMFLWIRIGPLLAEITLVSPDTVSIDYAKQVLEMTAACMESATCVQEQPLPVSLLDPPDDSATPVALGPDSTSRNAATSLETGSAMPPVIVGPPFTRDLDLAADMPSGKPGMSILEPRAEGARRMADAPALDRPGCGDLTHGSVPAGVPGLCE